MTEPRQGARPWTGRHRLAVLGTAAVLAAAGVLATWTGDDRDPTVELPEDVVVRAGCASQPCPEREPRPGAPCTNPHQHIAYCPDGRSGWTTGFTACVPTAALDRVKGTRPPASGVAMRLEVAASSAPAGPPLQADVVVRNDSDERVAFDVWPGVLGDHWEVKALGPARGNAHHGTDVGMLRPVRLDPGETERIPLLVPTRACADTPGRGEPVLPPGRYDLSARLLWGNVAVGDAPPSGSGPVGAWAGTAVLTLTR